VFGSTACLVCLIFECALTVQYLDSENRSGRIAAASFLWVYVVFWSLCVDGTQFTYVSEVSSLVYIRVPCCGGLHLAHTQQIWPNHLRAQGTSWALACFFVGSVITSVALPIAMEHIKGLFVSHNILRRTFKLTSFHQGLQHLDRPILRLHNLHHRPGKHVSD